MLSFGQGWLPAITGATGELKAGGGDLQGTGLELVRLEDGEFLFRQGDVGDSMYILASGQLDVTVAVPGAADRVLSTLEPSSIVGEMSLLLNEPRTANVVARGDCALWKVDAEGFEKASERGDLWASHFLLNVAQVLARRLAAMNDELVRLIGSTQAPAQLVDVRELEAIRTQIFKQ